MAEINEPVSPPPGGEKPLLEPAPPEATPEQLQNAPLRPDGKILRTNEDGENFWGGLSDEEKKALDEFNKQQGYY